MNAEGEGCKTSWVEEAASPEVESAWVGWRRDGGEQLGKRQVRDGRQAEERRGHGERKEEDGGLRAERMRHPLSAAESLHVFVSSPPFQC